MNGQVWLKIFNLLWVFTVFTNEIGCVKSKSNVRITSSKTGTNIKTTQQKFVPNTKTIRSRVQLPGTKNVWTNVFVFNAYQRRGRFVLHSVKDSEDMQVFSVQPHKVTEIEKNHTEVKSHTIFDFDERNFTSTEPVDVTRYGLDATTMIMSLTTSNGIINIELIIFKEEGNIAVESGEEYDVLQGAVKFNVEIVHWNFCGLQVACRDNDNRQIVSEGLEIMLEIAGKNEPNNEIPRQLAAKRGRVGKSRAREAPATYDIDGSELVVSSLIRLDGRWSNVTYLPKVIKNGTKTFLQLRFETFNQSVFYDPVGQSTDIKSNAIMVKNDLFLLSIIFAVLILQLDCN